MLPQLRNLAAGPFFLAFGQCGERVRWGFRPVGSEHDPIGALVVAPTDALRSDVLDTTRGTLREGVEDPKEGQNVVFGSCSHLVGAGRVLW